MTKWVSIVAASLAFACCGCHGEPASSDPAATAEVGRTSPAGNPFPAATEVRLFVNTDYDDNGRLILDGGLALTPSQRAEFESLLRVEPLPEQLAACFIPHHFFRYLDGAGNVLGEVEICFCCEGVSVSKGNAIKLTNGEQVGGDFAKLRAFVQSLGKPTDGGC